MEIPVRTAGFEREERQMDTACDLLGTLGARKMWPGGQGEDAAPRCPPALCSPGHLSPQAQAGCAEQMQHSLRCGGPDQGRGFLLQR